MSNGVRSSRALRVRNDDDLSAFRISSYFRQTVPVFVPNHVIRFIHYYFHGNPMKPVGILGTWSPLVRAAAIEYFEFATMLPGAPVITANCYSVTGKLYTTTSAGILWDPLELL